MTGRGSERNCCLKGTDVLCLEFNDSSSLCEVFQIFSNIQYIPYIPNIPYISNIPYIPNKILKSTKI